MIALISAYLRHSDSDRYYNGMVYGFYTRN